MCSTYPLSPCASLVEEGRCLLSPCRISSIVPLAALRAKEPTGGCMGDALLEGWAWLSGRSCAGRSRGLWRVGARRSPRRWLPCQLGLCSAAAPTGDLPLRCSATCVPVPRGGKGNELHALQPGGLLIPSQKSSSFPVFFSYEWAFWFKVKLNHLPLSWWQHRGCLDSRRGIGRWDNPPAERAGGWLRHVNS